MHIIDLPNRIALFNRRLKMSGNSSEPAAAMTTMEFGVNMTCGNCVAKTEDVLKTTKATPERLL